MTERRRRRPRRSRPRRRLRWHRRKRSRPSSRVAFALGLSRRAARVDGRQSRRWALGSSPVLAFCGAPRALMTIDLCPTTASDEPALSRLAQLYAYDFSEFRGWDVADDGLFGVGEAI